MFGGEFKPPRINKEEERRGKKRKEEERRGKKRKEEERRGKKRKEEEIRGKKRKEEERREHVEKRSSLILIAKTSNTISVKMRLKIILSGFPKKDL
jgi:hypothetical protein